MSTNQLIINFRNFLIHCWPTIQNVMDHIAWDDSPYYLDDWMQANWELLVEKPATKSGEFLATYGYLKDSECRYTNKGVSITHKITCQQLTSSEAKYDFIKFISKKNEAYWISPPFELVLVENIETKKRTYIPHSDLEYFIERI